MKPIKRLSVACYTLNTPLAYNKALDSAHTNLLAYIEIIWWQTQTTLPWVKLIMFDNREPLDQLIWDQPLDWQDSGEVITIYSQSKKRLNAVNQEAVINTALLW